MSQSHPPSLVTLVTQTLKRHTMWHAGECTLVAVSGGADSMVLLHVLAKLREKFGHRIAAHGVDHGLRANAATELDIAERFAAELGVPFSRTNLQVSSGGNLQARAREQRYFALETAAKAAGATRIATAHHADDRAETFILRLLRGSGPKGLAVLPPASGDRIRPLIGVRREQILAYAGRHHIPFSNDPSNIDPRFTRTRVRAEVLPLLHQLNPKIVEHLSILADQLAAANLPNAPEIDDFAADLPRTARDALAELQRSRSPHMQIALTGGLVASYDRAQDKVIVSRSKVHE